jgi:hypothetical protein
MWFIILVLIALVAIILIELWSLLSDRSAPLPGEHIFGAAGERRKRPKATPDTHLEAGIHDWRSYVLEHPKEILGPILCLIVGLLAAGVMVWGAADHPARPWADRTLFVIFGYFLGGARRLAELR